MHNFTQLSKFFEIAYPLNQHGLEELFSLFKLESHKKGSFILAAEQDEKQLRFLNKGIVREFYRNDSKEININFYTKPQFITDLLAFCQNQPTHKNQECLTEVEILAANKQQFFSLLEKYQCGKTMVDSSFQKLLKHKELWEFNRVTKTPEELYKELFIYKTDWLELIPQYHLTSFLNVTPETLSRIRKRIS